MQRDGNPNAGFTVDFEDAANRVRLEAWGFWDKTVADAFSDAVLEACRRGRRPFSLVADFTRLLPQSPDGQDAFRRVMTSASALGLTQATATIGNSITKLQLARLARETGAEGWTYLRSEGTSAP